MKITAETTHCPNGHDLAEVGRTSPKDSLGRGAPIKCRACERERKKTARVGDPEVHRALSRARKQRWRERQPGYVPGVRYSVDENTLPEDELARTDRPSAPWNVLKVKPEALAVWERFDQALSTTPTPCQGSPSWTEYDDPRPGREDEWTGTPMPTRSQAKVMCADCPLLKLCDGFARVEKPDWAVWGARVWLGGRPQ